MSEFIREKVYHPTNEFQCTPASRKWLPTDKLETDALVAGYYRDMLDYDLPEGEHASTLTDEEIIEVVDSVEGDNEDAEVERCEMLAEKSKLKTGIDAAA